jgi:nucleotide-binding universal stress UspA family protein
MSISLAHREGAELHVVHAWMADAENALRGVRSNMSETQVDQYVSGIKASREHLLVRLMQQARGWVGQDVFDAVEPKTHVVKGPAQKVVTELARTLAADLVVMGTVGRTGIPGFLIGNTAETILGGIECSVLAVKPDGFISPIELPG